MADPLSEMLQTTEQDLVENPIRAQIGLEPGDLYGAVLKAKRSLDNGDAVTALQQFSMLVLLDPMEVDHQVGLAEAALAMEMNEIAMQAAAFVITSAPRRPEGFVLSGRACVAMGEPALAAEDFADAIERAEAASEPEIKQVAARLLASVQSA